MMGLPLTWSSSMRRRLIALSFACATLLAACETSPVAQFWRPISEPNILMTSETSQQKITFDLRDFSIAIYAYRSVRVNAAHILEQVLS